MVAANGFVDVARGKLVQLLVVAKDDDGDVDGAQDGQLVGLFEQAAFALQKGAANRGSAGWARAGWKGANGGARVRKSDLH